MEKLYLTLVTENIKSSQGHSIPWPDITLCEILQNFKYLISIIKTDSILPPGIYSELFHTLLSGPLLNQTDDIYIQITD